MLYIIIIIIMYGFYKGDVLIVSFDLSKKLNFTVPFPICFGHGDAKLVHYAVLTVKHSYNRIPLVKGASLKWNTMVFPFLPSAAFVNVILFRLCMDVWTAPITLLECAIFLLFSRATHLLYMVHVMITVKTDRRRCIEPLYTYVIYKRTLEHDLLQTPWLCTIYHPKYTKNYTSLALLCPIKLMHSTWQNLYIIRIPNIHCHGNTVMLYALFNHPHMLIQVVRVQKAQFPYRICWSIP